MDNILTLEVEITLIISQGNVSTGGLGSQASFLDSELWLAFVSLSQPSAEVLSKYWAKE